MRTRPLGIVEGDEVMVRDSDAVGISGQVVQNLLRSTAGRLGVDHPVVDEQSLEEAEERCVRGEMLERAVELEFAAPEQIFEVLGKLAAEDAAERNDRQKEAFGAVDPLRPSAAKPPAGTM